MHAKYFACIATPVSIDISHNYLFPYKNAEYFANDKHMYKGHWLKYMCFLFGTVIAI
jgi:hypothetical protein